MLYLLSTRRLTSYTRMRIISGIVKMYTLDSSARSSDQVPPSNSQCPRPVHGGSAINRNSYNSSPSSTFQPCTWIPAVSPFPPIFTLCMGRTEQLLGASGARDEMLGQRSDLGIIQASIRMPRPWMPRQTLFWQTRSLWTLMLNWIQGEVDSSGKLYLKCSTQHQFLG
jgi:hypothetical protein